MLRTLTLLLGTAAAVSSNWAGYAVSGASFSTVSGSWVQPAASVYRRFASLAGPGALPGTLSADGSGFTVTWQRVVTGLRVPRRH